MDRASRKILKSPATKRRSRAVPINQRVTLERVLGLTTSNNAALSCDTNTGTIAYPAGCVIVLFNPRRNRQSHIFNFSKKTLTAVAFSGDGKHLVSGESGHQPAVRVWDVEEKTQVAEFHGHKFGINCVSFSPNLKYIVSVGTQHDMMVNLWNWKTGSKVASNKVSTKVSSVVFADDGSYFVTVGNRHVKFWYLETCKSKVKETLPLLGRSGILGDQRNNFFCDVVCGKGKQCKSTYVITQSGLLCIFNEKRILVKWVELRATSATGLAASEDYIYIGCGGGIVRVFSCNTLQFVTTLPFPHCLGVDVSTALNPSQMVSSHKDAKYPDTLALAYDDVHKKVTCIYNDHSLYIWDVHDIRKVGKAWSFLYHSSCIWGLEMYPPSVDGDVLVLPTGSFITCSSDDTIRVWNLDPHMIENDYYKKNIFSNELLNIHYIDPNFTSLRDVDYNPAGSADKTDTNFGGKNGVKSIRVSPDGQHLASGDRTGNIRIHDMKTMKEIKLIEAHDAEVLCLEYSHVKTGPKLLATASRDRLLHVFDVEQDYGLLQTLDDHSSSITAVRFTDTDQQLKMLSCGADKSLLFRSAQLTPDFQFGLSQHLVGKTTLYDMDVDPTHKFIITASQDRNIRIYNIQTAKQKKNYKGSVSDDGVLIKIQLDPSGSYAAASCTDKNICLIDICTGEIIATMYGHSEMATSVKFMSDFKHLITVSGDGCIFVWRLPGELTTTMRSRAEDIGKLPMVNGNISSAKKDLSYIPTPIMIDHIDGKCDYPVRDLVNSPNEDDFRALRDFDLRTPNKVLEELNRHDPFKKQDSNESTDSKDSKSSLDYRFSIGSLPKWAKSKIGSSASPGSEENNNVQPKGRWAQRVDSKNSLLVMSEFEEKDADRRRFTFEPDMPQNETSDVLRRETMVLDKSEITPKKIPIIIDDENNNDEDDDDDLFPSFHKLDGSSSQNSSGSDSKSEGKKWGNRRSMMFDRNHSFDLDEDDVDSTSEVIYFPQRQSGDTSASSFQVFAVDGDSKTKGLRSEKSMDAASESTDTVSVDDDDDEDSQTSNPTTPMEDFTPKTPDREKFLRDTFENMSFTPVSTEKFTQRLDDLEGKFGNNSETPLSERMNQRLSLSARFMSRSQQANIRNMAVYNSIQRQDNWFDSLQHQKDEMARAVDETRKRLLAMGWKNRSTEEPEKDVTSLSLSEPSLNTQFIPYKLEFEDEEKTPTNKNQFATFADSNTDYQSESRGGTYKDEGEKTPTGSRSTPMSPRSNMISPRSPRPHSLQLNKTESVASKIESNQVSKTMKGSSRLSQNSMYKKQTESSKLKSGTTKNKIFKSSSTSSLLKKEDSQKSSASASRTTAIYNLESKKEPLKPKQKLSSNKRMLYASVPNLATCVEESEEEHTSNLTSCVDLSKSSPDINVDGKKDHGKKKEKKNVKDGIVSLIKRRSGSTSQLKDSKVKGNRLSLLPNSVDKVSNTKTCGSWNKKLDEDSKQLMPPPVLASVAKTKHDSFIKKAVQVKRRSTSDLTLDQAKDILLGRSGILGLSSTSNVERSTSSDSVNDSSAFNLPGSFSLNSTFPSESNNKSYSSDQELASTSLTVDPSLFLVASEIESIAAEMRCQQPYSLSELDVSPNDLPEKDMPSSAASMMKTSTSRSQMSYFTPQPSNDRLLAKKSSEDRYIAKQKPAEVANTTISTSSFNNTNSQVSEISSIPSSAPPLPLSPVPTLSHPTRGRDYLMKDIIIIENDTKNADNQSNGINRRTSSRSKTPTGFRTGESSAKGRSSSDVSENTGRSARSKTPTSFLNLESNDKASGKPISISERRGSSSRSKTPTSFCSSPQPVPLTDDGDEAGSSPSVRERIANLRKNIETKSSSPGSISPRSVASREAMNRAVSPARCIIESNLSAVPSQICDEPVVKEFPSQLGARRSSIENVLDDATGFDSEMAIDRHISAITNDSTVTKQENSDKSFSLTCSSSSALGSPSTMSPCITTAASSSHQFSSTPAEKTLPELQTCLNAMADLKKAVRSVTELYEKVISQSDEQSSKISRMLEQSVEENQKTIINFVSKHNLPETACTLATHGGLLNLPQDQKETNSEMQQFSPSASSQSSIDQELLTQAMSLVEPMMEKYANSLSDRLVDVLNRKLDQSTP